MRENVKRVQEVDDLLVLGLKKDSRPKVRKSPMSGSMLAGVADAAQQKRIGM